MNSSEETIWDSGRVESDVSIHIAYGGPELRSDTAYGWRVCVWNQDGVALWSRTAAWSTGLLRPEEYVAPWMTMDSAAEEEDSALSSARARSADLEEACWIALPDELRTRPADVYDGVMTGIRRRIAFTPGKKPRSAWLYFQGDCRPLAFFNGQRVSTGYHYRYPTWTEVTPYLNDRNDRDSELSFLLNNAASYGVGEDFTALIASLTVVFEDTRAAKVEFGISWRSSLR